MNDILIDDTGDIYIDNNGDISLTSNVVQAVKTRLKWFYDEWKFGPELGFPYFEQVFIKNPNTIKIQHFIRELILDVSGVSNVEYVNINIDKKTRTATINISFTANEETYQEEVQLYE